MTQDPMKNNAVCAGLVTYLALLALAMAVSAFFELYLSLPVCALLLLPTGLAGGLIDYQRRRITQLEDKAVYLSLRLDKLERTRADSGK